MLDQLYVAAVMMPVVPVVPVIPVVVVVDVILIVGARSVAIAVIVSISVIVVIVIVAVTDADHDAPAGIRRGNHRRRCGDGDNRSKQELSHGCLLFKVDLI